MTLVTFIRGHKIKLSLGVRRFDSCLPGESKLIWQCRGETPETRAVVMRVYRGAHHDNSQPSSLW